MTVQNTSEIHRGRGGSTQVRAGGKTITRHVRAFLVTTDDPTDDETDIKAQGPEIGDAHPNNADAFLRNKSAEQLDESALAWSLICEYDDEFEYEPDPTDEAAKISWDTESFQRPAFKDNAGKAILNAAGDPFDPLPQRDDSRWTATIVKNVTSVPTWILTYNDAINSDVFILDGISIAALTAKISRISISEATRRDGTLYRVLTIVMQFRVGGWREDILNRGFRYVSGASLVLVESTVDPVLLTASGALLANPTPSTATFITAQIYDEQPFSVLPLT